MPGDNLAKILNGPWTVPEPPSPERQFLDAIIGQGITPPESILFDGKIHRFATSDKPGDDAGWYVAFGDGIHAGAFGDHRSGETVTFVESIGRELSIAEQMARRSKIEQAKAKAKADREARYTDAADTVQQIWDGCQPASPDHPYLQAKGIQPHVARVSGDGRLVLPLYDIDGGLTSLQYVDATGDKKYHPGGKTGGSMCDFGVLGDKVYIAEGYATAATIYEETATATIAAYSAQNIVRVAESIRQRFPTISMTIVADNDASGAGENYAHQAAAKYGATVIVPPDQGDANDYRQAGGDVAALLNPPRDEWLVSVADFIAKPEPIRWLVKDWIQRNALVMVHGQSGSGKTFLVLDWALRIASGETEWDGKKIHGGAFVYLAGEGHIGLKKRMAGWIQHHNVRGDIPAYVSKSGTDLDTPEGYAFAADHIRSLEVRPDLIIVDTLHRFLSGDENSAKDTRAMLKSCAALMDEFGCTVLLVHHTGVNPEAQTRGRGSSAWKGALDIEISVTPKDGLFKVACMKSKDAEQPAPVWCRFEQIDVDGWTDEDGNPVNTAVLSIAESPEAKGGNEARDSFVAAYQQGGVDGKLYRQTWEEWLIEHEEITEATAKKKTKASSGYAKTLIESGAITPIRKHADNPKSDVVAYEIADMQLSILCNSKS